MRLCCCVFLNVKHTDITVSNERWPQAKLNEITKPFLTRRLRIVIKPSPDTRRVILSTLRTKRSAMATR